MTSTTHFAQPEPAAQQHSERLFALIQHQIDLAGGKISFADYMNYCLYTPGLGYYSNGTQKIGESGDFTTAPEISPLFSQSLAHHARDVMHQLPGADILEFGAGSGKMAGDILLELAQANAAPKHYYIIEASADLRLRQQKYLRFILGELFDTVVWLSNLPDEFTGVIFANEVCDAMPVHRIQFTGIEVTELMVSFKNNELCYTTSPITNAELGNRIQQIQPLIQHENYITEVNLAADAWLRSLADTLKQGAIFIIDYGYPRQAFYHPQRSNGTLMCYYQHKAHDNALILPGLQDITSHIDFTNLAETALESGLDVEGFQAQADFLLAAGITELLSETGDEFTDLQQKTALKRLLLPSAMGEDFKVLTLGKDLDQLLPRVQLADRRHSL
jgi:SAM-dependent MidA family methyltransferase